MYRFLLKPLLFLLPPERAHYLSMNTFAFLCRIPLMAGLLRWMLSGRDKGLATEQFGLKFRNPIGLAAGFDKDARWVDALSCLGFGFVEIGTVTPRPQVGNPQPRLFRLPEDEGLINRMGFNNQGAAAAAERLRKRRSDIIIGGNIGKNKDTPLEKAADDYASCFEILFEVVDYFAVNVSSPNTPGLRSLQDREPLSKILKRLQKINSSKSNPKPILLKIAPDLTNEQLDEVVELILEIDLDGMICANTTISREGLKSAAKEEPGGSSGAPVKMRATEVINYVRSKAGPVLPIIGVGGVFKGADALAKMDAGAQLVQVYTGFIYEGPRMVAAIKSKLGNS